MTLPISPSFPPMEASCLLKIPSDAEWQYEPKYNSQGESLQSLFPSCWSLLQQLDADRYVLDREIVISAGEISSFERFIAAHSSGCIGMILLNRPRIVKKRCAVS